MVLGRRPGRAGAASCGPARPARQTAGTTRLFPGRIGGSPGDDGIFM